jgi:cysteinyl-tRNA synthetase
VWADALARETAAAEPTAAPSGDEVLRLVARRAALRAAHDWAGADQVREALVARGWQVDDTPDGPRVRPAG